MTKSESDSAMVADADGGGHKQGGLLGDGLLMLSSESEVKGRLSQWLRTR